MQTTTPPDIADLLQRQNELLEQLVSTNKRTQTNTQRNLGISQRQGRLISLGLLWGIIIAVLLHMAVVAGLARLADTRLGQALGIEAPAETAPVGNGSDRPLKKGDVLGDWVVTSGMGPRQSPGGIGSTDHAGVDLAHKTGPGRTMGHPLTAPFATLVACSQSSAGGIGATLEGEGVRLRMLHLSQCKPGRVEPGDVFGHVGNTGNSTGPHLHLELYQGGTLVNPTERWAAAVLGIQIAGGGDAVALAVETIKQFEGFHPTPYWDYAQHSWGFGTRAPGPNGTITREQAELDLRAYLDRNCWPRIPNNLQRHQRAALASLCYNIGPAQFAGSDALRHATAGNHAAAADGFNRWTRAGGKQLQGLVTRRAKERQIYLGQ